MNVITKNPVIVDGENVSSKDYYSNADSNVSVDMEYIPEEQVTTDGITVSTKYPIVLNGSEVSPRSYYSNAVGQQSVIDAFFASNLAAAQEQAKKTGSKPTTQQQEQAKEKGVFWDNVKKSWQSFTNSETGKMALAQIDAAITARREAKYGTTFGSLPTDEISRGGQPTSEPMSTTTKVLLIGGGLLVVGLIVYSMVVKGGQK